jgi:TRAP-type C4-dicarboxylate transport system permease small subunit
MSIRRALPLAVAGLALHFCVCVGIYAWKIKRTTFDPMTYTMFELEWIIKLVVLGAVFLGVRLMAKFVLRRRARTSASSAP